MADEKRVEGSPARARGKITLSMEELSASLDSFLVEPRGTRRGRVVAAEDTAEINCTGGATCNFKCGDTAYWECGDTSLPGGCDTWVNTCYSCGYTCPTCDPRYPDC